MIFGLWDHASAVVLHHGIEKARQTLLFPSYFLIHWLVNRFQTVCKEMDVVPVWLPASSAMRIFSAPEDYAPPCVPWEAARRINKLLMELLNYPGCTAECILPAAPQVFDSLIMASGGGGIDWCCPFKRAGGTGALALPREATAAVCRTDEAQIEQDRNSKLNRSKSPSACSDWGTAVSHARLSGAPEASLKFSSYSNSLFHLQG